MGYWAPEIVGSECEVTPAIDMWSLGVSVYEMAVGYHPSAMDKNFRRAEGKLLFHKRDWQKWDESLIDFVKSLI